MEDPQKNQKNYAHEIKREAAKIHKVLAHSYSFYFLLFLFGFLLDLIFPIKIFNGPWMASVGLAMLALASMLIFWSQSTSRNMTKENLSKDTFLRGPYRFSSNPTHWGLFFLIMGFGITANSFFVVLFTFISFFVSKLTFVKKMEKMLVDKYGPAYLEYKKSLSRH